MSLAVKMLNPVVVKHTKGKSIVRVDFLWIFLHMSLLLHSLKLGIQKNCRILDGMFHSFRLSDFGLLFDNIRENGVING